MAVQPIPEEVLRGKIAATKALVKKVDRPLKEKEKELSGLTEDEVRAMNDEQLRSVIDSLCIFHLNVEKALGFIVENFDGGIADKEADIHEALIDQVTVGSEQRPAVLDKSVAENLPEYMELRLDFENNTPIDAGRVWPLLQSFKTVSAAIRQELNDFFDSLKEFHEKE